MKTIIALACAAGVFGLSQIFAADADPADDGPASRPTVKIFATDPVALEGASSGAFTIVRRGDRSAELTVHYAITGTASNGVDYVKIPDSLRLAPGAVSSNLVVQPIDNHQFDHNARVVVELSANADYRLTSHRRAAVEIIDATFNNVPPLVALVQPGSNTVVRAGTNVTLEAQATDPDDPVAVVSFFANERRLASLTNAPYSLVWSNVPPGRFHLRAVARDRFGESSRSAEVILLATNVPPKVTLVSPKDGDQFAFGDKIGLKAAAMAGDGQIARVSFFANNHFLGSVRHEPYDLVWARARPGDFTLRAVATDEFGTPAKSDAVHITVKGPRPDQAGSGEDDQEVKRLPHGGVQITFEVSTDGNYQVEFSRNLKTWKPLAVVASVKGKVTYVSDGGEAPERGFYRIVPVPPGNSP